MNTWSLILRSVLFIICSCYLLTASGQQPIKEFFSATYTDEQYDALKQLVGRNKKIPAAYEKQILLALSYFPELQNSHIIFRVKSAHSPLAARPSWLSVFKRKDSRTYIITISKKNFKKKPALLFQLMSFNAQVGVIGHELSHITEFNQKNSLDLLKIGFGNMSTKFLDKFEYRTDSICIAHGLGYQLLAWSKFVRTALNIETWRGVGTFPKDTKPIERYMNPGTIEDQMKNNPLYH
jgi:hypothetical protein